jgi:hypothetical protein
MLEDKRFMLGMVLGCVLDAFVMFSVWLFNIVPVEQMTQFDSDKQNVFVLIAFFFGVIFASGFLATKIFKPINSIN